MKFKNYEYKVKLSICDIMKDLHSQEEPRKIFRKDLILSKIPLTHVCNINNAIITHNSEVFYNGMMLIPKDDYDSDLRVNFLPLAGDKIRINFIIKDDEKETQGFLNTFVPDIQKFPIFCNSRTMGFNYEYMLRINSNDDISDFYETFPEIADLEFSVICYPVEELTKRGGDYYNKPEPCTICRNLTVYFLRYSKGFGYSAFPMCSDTCYEKFIKICREKSGYGIATTGSGIFKGYAEEIYENFYFCPNCFGTSIADSFTYCPDCGMTIIIEK